MKNALALLFAAGFTLAIGAQNLGEQPLEGRFGTQRAEPGSIEAIPMSIRSEALAVSVRALMNHPEIQEPWQASERKYTIPGTPVSIKLVGSDVAVVISITPNRTRDGSLFMIAQGQVWFRDTDGTVRYRSTVDTVGVNFGEKLLFYPFGVFADGNAPLRIELVVEQYKENSPSAPQAAGTSGSGQ